MPEVIVVGSQGRQGRRSLPNQRRRIRPAGTGDVAKMLDRMHHANVRHAKRSAPRRAAIIRRVAVTDTNSDIKLPTDGFRSANEFEQLLGYQEHAGVSGEGRPGPTAKDQEAPSPDVSDADPAAIVPGNPQPEQRSADKKNRKKKDRSADAAAPGFSL